VEKTSGSNQRERQNFQKEISQRNPPWARKTESKKLDGEIKGVSGQSGGLDEKFAEERAY